MTRSMMLVLLAFVLGGCYAGRTVQYQIRSDDPAMIAADSARARMIVLEVGDTLDYDRYEVPGADESKSVRIDATAAPGDPTYFMTVITWSTDDATVIEQELRHGRTWGWRPNVDDAWTDLDDALAARLEAEFGARLHRMERHEEKARRP